MNRLSSLAMDPNVGPDEVDDVIEAVPSHPPRLLHNLLTYFHLYLQWTAMLLSPVNSGREGN